MLAWSDNNLEINPNNAALPTLPQPVPQKGTK
jgi:hypothetical protein